MFFPPFRCFWRRFFGLPPLFLSLFPLPLSRTPFLACSGVRVRVAVGVCVGQVPCRGLGLVGEGSCAQHGLGLGAPGFVCVLRVRVRVRRLSETVVF